MVFKFFCILIIKKNTFKFLLASMKTLTLEILLDAAAEFSVMCGIVVDTGGNFAAGVVDTCGKYATGGVDIGGAP
jgi:hypothetical protein